jgi:glycosyltransferase involved in cell wall biosynthesis
MLSQFYAPIVGGEERVVEDTAHELARRGHDVSVATLRAPGQPVLEIDRGVRIHRIDGLAQRVPFVFRDAQRRHAPPWPDPGAVRALKGVLEKERPQIVHAHNWLVHSYLPTRRRSRARLVVSLHDYGLVCATKRLMYEGASCDGPERRKCRSCSATHYGSIKGPPVAVMSRVMGERLIRHVDMFLPVSNAVARHSALAERRLPFEVLPNFMPDAEKPQAPELDAEFLAKLPAENFIMFAGDLTHEKGVDVLLEAHAGMENRPPLVLIGRNDQRPDLKATDVRMLGLATHPNVLEAWRRCSIAVVPSLWEEPFGIVALEAMAMGKPVVASRVGGLSDIVVDSKTGLLVPPGDAEALRAALVRLDGDSGLRQTMSAAASVRIQDFAATKVVERLESIYERVAA